MNDTDYPVQQLDGTLRSLRFRRFEETNNSCFASSVRPASRPTQGAQTHDAKGEGANSQEDEADGASRPMIANALGVMGLQAIYRRPRTTPETPG